MSTGSTIVVSVSRRFDAAAERVFDAWLDVERARRWMFASAPETVVRAEIDARVGGRFVVVDRRDGEDVEHVGEYLEIERPRRLVFTFGIPQDSPDMDRVTVEIVPAVRGCELTLTHEMDARWAEYRARTEAGWNRMLAGLQQSLEELRVASAGEVRGGYGRVTEPGTIRFERLLPGPIERVWGYLTESEKRSRWLAPGEMELRAGGGVELHFRHEDLSPHTEGVPEKYRQYEAGGIVRGRVTRCEPPHLLSHTWGEAEGYDSEVTFELQERAGGVLLVLTHRRLAGRATMLSVAAGWHTHLDILVDRLAGRVPEPFWTTHGHWEAEYERRLGAA
jgi:uncharacterized protein YndB with AHSA1/START domain